ncbi:MAG: hypothetical protein ACC645_13380 [Pirellulales bacterium]
MGWQHLDPPATPRHYVVMATATRAKNPLHVSAEVNRIGRAIAVHMQAGRFGVAREVLDRAILERERPAGPEPVVGDSPLAATGLALRTINLLEEFDIRTVADLDATTNTQLRRVPHIGPDTIKLIRNTAARARRTS